MAVVLVLSAFLGEPILELFGIKMASFSVAGGILVLIMAIAMLSSRPDRTTPEETAEAARKHGLAVAPLAVPLIAAGPAAISSVILYAQQAKDWFDTVLAQLLPSLAGRH